MDVKRGRILGSLASKQRVFVVMSQHEFNFLSKNMQMSIFISLKSTINNLLVTNQNPAIRQSP